MDEAMQMRTQRISSKRINNIALGTVLILALQVSSVSGQSNSSQDQPQRTYPVVSWETYDRVLDIVFPRADPDTSKTIFEFVLRFRPSFHATSQIVIRKRVDKIEVVEYTTPDGNIFDKLNEILDRGGKEDAVAMAKSIRVKRREISVPSTQVKQWYATFFDSLVVTTKTVRERGERSDKTRSVTLVLDGTTYDLWYKQSLDTISLSLYDVEVDTPASDGELKLVQWMNAVRREVGRLK
jgi:hypothetical protein